MRASTAILKLAGAQAAMTTRLSSLSRQQAASSRPICTTAMLGFVVLSPEVSSSPQLSKSSTSSVSRGRPAAAHLYSSCA